MTEFGKTAAFLQLRATQQQGFTVRKGTVKKQCGEFYTTDAAGKEVELFLNPVNGEVVGRM